MRSRESVFQKYADSREAIVQEPVVQEYINGFKGDRPALLWCLDHDQSGTLLGMIKTMPMLAECNARLRQVKEEVVDQMEMSARRDSEFAIRARACAATAMTPLKLGGNDPPRKGGGSDPPGEPPPPRLIKIADVLRRVSAHRNSDPVLARGRDRGLVPSQS